jgi:hypothetical protein
MKVKIELDLTPEEAKELFIPSDKQSEFISKTYDAYVSALQKSMIDQFDLNKQLENVWGIKK